MAISISFNGLVYSIPETGDESWGENLTSYFIAIPQGALQKSGGNFTLTADVNFGANFGLLSRYFSTRTALPSTAGLVRLALSDTIGWRNNANSANLLLAVNASDQLTFNGSAVYPGGITALTGDVVATGPGSVAATISANAVTNAKFRQSVALSVVGNTTNATANVDDIVAGTDGFVLRRLGAALSFGLLVNANIDPAAGIAFNKMAAMSTSKVPITDGSGFVVASVVTSTELAYLIGVTSSIQTQLNSKQATGNFLTGITGDVSASGPGNAAATIGANKVTLAMLAQMATASFLGRNTASTGNVEVLTATVATAILNILVGDSGSGGTKGLVPAPASGDAAALKFLKADGTWAVPTGSGTVTSVAMTVPTGLFSVSPVAGSPITGSGTLAPVLAVQTSGYFFCGPTGGAAAAPTFRALQTPTVQNFTSASGTYTTPAGALYIRVRMVGGGGGGGTAGTLVSVTATQTGSTGGNTTFGTSLLTANGGGGGANGVVAAAGSGGTATVNASATTIQLIALTGAAGNLGANISGNVTFTAGGSGGSSLFGGAGSSASGAAVANTGSGGGGGNSGATPISVGNGGGAGGFVEAIIITTPGQTFSYSVGALGAAGSTSGAISPAAGGNGASGYIQVTAHYQ